MNDFLNWHKSLNLKKVIIVSSIIIILISIIIVLAIPKKTKKAEEINSPSYILNSEKNTTTFFDINKTFSIELSNNYNLNLFKSDSYLLELRNTEKNLNIFISSKDLIANKSLNDVVFADKLAFTESFQNISNISELRELNINNNLAYTYSFHYLDTNLNKTFYLQTTWMQINNIYYIFDIEFPLNDINNYTNLITDTLSSFSI